MSVLLRPDFRKDIVWYEIRRLSNGGVISRTHSIGDASAKLRWIVQNIMGDAECHYEDIDFEDSDDGEFITVRGERYAQVVTDFSQTAEHKDAMEEREAITANASAYAEIERLKATIAFLEHELDIWKDRYEAADEALEQCIRQWDKESANGI
jgi:hypothetical protein